MKYIIALLYAFGTYGYTAFAASDNILGIDNKKLREGDVHLDDIPLAIKSATDFFIGLAGTVAVIFIIIGAYQILFGGLTGDRTKGRNTIIMALTGFALAALAWVIIKIIVSNLA